MEARSPVVAVMANLKTKNRPGKAAAKAAATDGFSAGQ
jgi:hypothetical protein